MLWLFVSITRIFLFYCCLLCRAGRAPFAVAVLFSCPVLVLFSLHDELHCCVCSCVRLGYGGWALFCLLLRGVSVWAVALLCCFAPLGH